MTPSGNVLDPGGFAITTNHSDTRANGRSETASTWSSGPKFEARRSVRRAGHSWRHRARRVPDRGVRSACVQRSHPDVRLRRDEFRRYVGGQARQYGRGPDVRGRESRPEERARPGGDPDRAAATGTRASAGRGLGRFQSLLVWSGIYTGLADVGAARLSGTGRFSTPTASPISAELNGQQEAAVAFGGGQYLVCLGGRPARRRVRHHRLSASPRRGSSSIRRAS